MTKITFMVALAYSLPGKLWSANGSLGQNRTVLTCWRKRLRSGLDWGSMVAWNAGRKMFSSILPKWGTKFLALKTSLEETSGGRHSEWLHLA